MSKRRSGGFRKTRKLIHDSETAKKMNCNPITEKQSIDKGTCYTPEALHKMKSEFNHLSNTNNTKITASEPRQILKDLTTALSDKCSDKKEDCLIKQLPRINKELRDKLFAPYQPKEWKINHNEWLSNFDIEDVLKQYEEAYPSFKLLGPTSIDFDKTISDRCVDEEFCKFDLKKFLKEGKTDIGMSFNLANHDEEGTHWVSQFVHIDKKLGHSFIFYFDSVGMRPPKEITELIKRIKEQGKELGINFKYIRNKKEHQRGDSECGMYSLFFIITFLTGFLINPKLLELKETKKGLLGTEGGISYKSNLLKLIQFFTTKRISDKSIERFRDFYFNP